MTLKMSKNDKALFYYLGLTLLALIVLGAVFGISSVKESFGTPEMGSASGRAARWARSWGRWRRWARRKARKNETPEDRAGRKMTKCCIAAGAPGDRGATRKDWCKTDIKNGGLYSC